MKILVTGGAGFIGSAVVRYIIDRTDDHVVNVDKLTYAGNLKNLAAVANSSRYAFEQADICNRQCMEYIFQQYRPDAVIHMAAESHVDRSVWGSADFIETNVVGTHTLLEVAREYRLKLTDSESASFRFYQVSTDEVYGDLGFEGAPAREDSAYIPSSPYSASKAAADHLVRAWHRTYGLPVLISCSSNNYGPHQYPEKLIPLMISNALKNRALPVYGDGLQVRDWLYVDDHAEAIYRVLKNGKTGETYNISGNCHKENIDVIDCLCDVLQAILWDRDATDRRLLKSADGFRSLIEYVSDRPGHDVRYAIDSKKIQAELGWYPKESFETGLAKTITWYLDHGRDFYPEVF